MHRGLEAALKRVSKQAVQYEYQMKDLEASSYSLPKVRSPSYTVSRQSFRKTSVISGLLTISCRRLSLVFKCVTVSEPIIASYMTCSGTRDGRIVLSIPRYHISATNLQSPWIPFQSSQRLFPLSRLKWPTFGMYTTPANRRLAGLFAF
jgi:hypothetical protein